MPKEKPTTTETGEQKPLDFREEAGRVTLEWAKACGFIPLRIELVAPLKDNIAVWLFYDTDKRMKEYEEGGITQKVKDKYIACLKTTGYPAGLAHKVMFFVDSDENVEKIIGGVSVVRID